MARISKTPSKGSGTKQGHRWPRELRLAVARAAVDERLNTRQVAQQFGVPYTTATAWVARYCRGGEKALLAATPPKGSKGPPDSPRRRAILAVKAKHPGAGSRRIRDVMRRFLGIGASETTVRRVLKAEGLTQKKPRAKPKPQPQPKRFERAEPNSNPI